MNNSYKSSHCNGTHTSTECAIQVSGVLLLWECEKTGLESTTRSRHTFISPRATTRCILRFYLSFFSLSSNQPCSIQTVRPCISFILLRLYLVLRQSGPCVFQLLHSCVSVFIFVCFSPSLFRLLTHSCSSLVIINVTCVSTKPRGNIMMWAPLSVFRFSSRIPLLVFIAFCICISFVSHFFYKEH